MASTTTTTHTNGHQQIPSSKPKPAEHGNWQSDSGFLPGRETVGPLFLMLVTPVFSIVLFHVTTQMQSDFFLFGKECMEYGFQKKIFEIWPSPFDKDVLKIIGYFFALQLILQKYMPGKEFIATVTPKGNCPVYKANGMASYIFTLVLLLALNYFNVFKISTVYDKFGEILSSMNLFSWIFCTILLIKGHVAPSTTDSGSNGNFIIDFWWGMELYPRIFGWDVKQFTNCRIGLMYWAAGIVCYAAKNMELNDGNLQLGMFVNVVIQLVYLTKFYHWEMGYMCSMDIQHDRAGYYICWGCLVWVPSIYTSSSFYLVENCPDLPPPLLYSILVIGVLMVAINYDSDRQRYVFRQSEGKCLIWGKKPKMIVAEYTTSEGNVRKSLLLLSGWWSISRHFHYMPEILATLCWSLPAWNTAFIAPYFYVVFLTILLLDRSYRDDERCRNKYGIYWDSYCKEVPYKIVPGIL